MSSSTYRDRWIACVCRAGSISDAVRVALLRLGYDMDEGGIVEFSQRELGEALGRSERRIRDRVKEAVAAGFLVRLARGQRNGASRYQGTAPDLDRPESLTEPGAADFQPDTLQPVENLAQPDTRVSGRDTSDPALNRSPGCPVEAPRIDKDRARARSGSTHSNHQGASPRTAVTTPHSAELKSVSQSARAREARRYLTRRYGLTDGEASRTWTEVERRAAAPIEHPVPYLKAMAEGDLADIAGAAQEHTPPADPPPPPPEPIRPAPVLRLVPDPPPAPPAMPADKAKAAAHLGVCKTPRCERCDALAAQYPDLRRSGT